MPNSANRLLSACLLLLAVGLVPGCGGGTTPGSDPNADDDGDGVANGLDAFPNDAAETLDTDNDGTGDNADTDDDADGVPDEIDDKPLDTDNDTLPNEIDTDDDDDGVPDTTDAFPLDQSESVDSDGDGIGDNADMDNTPGSTMTVGLAPCMINSNEDGLATFTGSWTWLDGEDPFRDLTVAYNIQDNSTACGGIGTKPKPAPIANYTLTWKVRVPIGYSATVSLQVNNETGSPEVVQDYTDTTLTISTPDDAIGGGGSWSVSGCPLNITSVTPAFEDDEVIIVGSISCDGDADPPQTLMRPAPIPGLVENSIKLEQPLTFRTLIVLID